MTSTGLGLRVYLPLIQSRQKGAVAVLACQENGAFIGLSLVRDGLLTHFPTYNVASPRLVYVPHTVNGKRTADSGKSLQLWTQKNPGISSVAWTEFYITPLQTFQNIATSLQSFASAIIQSGLRTAHVEIPPWIIDTLSDRGFTSATKSKKSKRLTVAVSPQNKSSTLKFLNSASNEKFYVYLEWMQPPNELEHTWLSSFTLQVGIAFKHRSNSTSLQCPRDWPEGSHVFGDEKRKIRVSLTKLPSSLQESRYIMEIFPSGSVYDEIAEKSIQELEDGSSRSGSASE